MPHSWEGKRLSNDSLAYDLGYNATADGNCVVPSVSNGDLFYTMVACVRRDTTVTQNRYRLD